MWRLQNNSGATINVGTGAYTAGSTPSVVDTVAVSDSLGNTANVTVNIGTSVAMDSLSNHAATIVTVTSGVAVLPTTARVATGDSIQFSVSGGSGSGYVWSIPTNSSAGTIATNGLYIAGAKAGGDTVSVVNSLGNAATATVTVSAGALDAGTPHDGAVGDAGDDETAGSSGCSSSPSRGVTPTTLLEIIGALFLLSRYRRRGISRAGDF
jgi:hypothetical protein